MRPYKSVKAELKGDGVEYGGNVVWQNVQHPQILTSTCTSTRVSYHLLVHNQLLVPGRDRGAEVHDSFVLDALAHCIAVPVRLGRTHAEAHTAKGVAAGSKRGLTTTIDRCVKQLHVFLNTLCELNRLFRSTDC